VLESAAVPGASYGVRVPTPVHSILLTDYEQFGSPRLRRSMYTIQTLLPLTVTRDVIIFVVITFYLL
jgi:hypothetical protein